MKLNLKAGNLYNYVKLTLALIAAFWVLSIYEVVNMQTRNESFVLPRVLIV